MKNSVKIFIMACAAACAGSSFASETSVINQSFATSTAIAESNGDGASVATASITKNTGETWSGDGVVTNSSVSKVGETTYPASAIGYPCGSAPTVGNFLVVDGACTCTDSGSNAAYYYADYLVNLVEPCGILLEESEDEALKGVQIAVAAGTAVTGDAVPFCVYCQTNSTYATSANKTNGWVTTTETISTGKWHRVRLTFDYAHSRCLVALDGIPAASEYGYANPTNGSAKGAWYPLASPTSGSKKIAELQLLGLGRVDEVKIASSATASDVTADYGSTTVPADVTGTGSVFANVTRNDLNKWGVSTNTAYLAAVKADNSGLTVSEKLQCGLDPTDGKVFEVTSMTANGTTATLTVPRTYNESNGNGYKVTYAVTVDGSAALSDANATGSDGKATLTVSELSDTAGVNKIVVTATAANP